MSESTPKPRRRWTSISLRGLMLLVLIIGGPMAWMARKASLQQRAVAKIKAIGGAVVYDWEYGGNVWLRKPGASVPGPVWLRKLVGDDYFQTVVQVNIPESLQFHSYLFDGSDPLKDRTKERKAFHERYVKPIEDDQLACLDGFDRLESLMIQQAFVLKPEGLARLGGLTRLKELHMNGQFGDDVLDRLAPLTNVETLSFQLNFDHETNLAFLEKMSKLRLLTIGGLNMTDDQMMRVGRLPSLKYLTVTGNELTDVGLAHLKDLKSLENLNIMLGPKLTGGGLASLEGLTNLNSVWLTGMPMDKAGLDHLARLPRLPSLGIAKGQFDDKTLDDFKAKKPGITVTILPTFNFPR